LQGLFIPNMLPLHSEKWFGMHWQCLTGSLWITHLMSERYHSWLMSNPNIQQLGNRCHIWQMTF
jgi:hypothetical protein